jgi:polyhydroxybutyrate depolymerase
MNVDETNDDRRYEPYIKFVHANSLFSKYALRPDQPMTRAQMSHLVHQLVLEKEDELTFDNKRDSSSPGCSEKQPTRVPTSSVVDGRTRSYITSIGKKYHQKNPTKLIFAFHGRTSPNTEVRGYYKLEKNWDQDAIIIYPSGLPEEGPSRNRGAPSGEDKEIRDYALFDTLVEEFSENYCIDMDEIYAVGHSLGAWFTNSLGCARGDVLRGIGSVGGSTTLSECSGPVAAMIMHHPDDNLA